MPTEEIQPAEGETQQPEVEAPQEPQEEYVPLRFRGEERQVRKALIDELAQTLGGSEIAAANRVQQMWEADRVFQESKRKEQEWQRHLRDLEEQTTQRQQQIEQEWQKRLAQAQGGLSKPDPDDPVELLKLSVSEQRKLAEKIAAIEQRQEEERQHFAAMIEEQRQVEDSQRISAAYEGAKKEFTEKYKKIELPSEAEIEDYLLETGLANNRRVPWERAFRIALRDLTYDQIPQLSSADTLDRLRNPQAKIVTPGSSGPAVKPVEKKTDLEAMIGDMKMGEVIPNLPSAR